MSLSTGASLITLSLLLNKLTGLYGIIALFTGYHLSPFQLSMYIYSIIALVLTAYLAQHIRSQSPLHCLALAYFYCLDSVINAAYTAAFAATWFLVLAQHNAGKPGSSAKGPGAGTIDDTSGFTSPQFNASGVEISANGAQDNVEISHVPSDSPAGVADGTLANAVLTTESMNSIGVIIALWTIRAYFCLIMLAYARQVLRTHMSLASTSLNIKNRSGLDVSAATDYTAASADPEIAENPFADTKPAGQGWKGRLGRIMTAFPRRYWLGADDTIIDSGLIASMDGRFRRNAEPGYATPAIQLKAVETPTVTPGTSERERRRRSGTGPPEPDVQLLAQQQNKQQENQTGDGKTGLGLTVPVAQTL